MPGPDPARPRRTVVLIRLGPGPRSGLLEPAARQIAALASEGELVVIPETGTGLDPGRADPKGPDIPAVQAATALARSETDRILGDSLAARGMRSARVCFSVADLGSRERHLHIRNALFGLLAARVCPLVFLNEATSDTGLEQGAASGLAALLAPALEAGLLLVLEAGEPPAAKDLWEKTARAGVAVRVRDVGEEGAGEDQPDQGGDYYRPRPEPFDPALWEALTLASKGAIEVGPDYAARLSRGRQGLTPEQVAAVRGRFGPGAQVNIKDPEGRILAVGLSNYSSADLGRLAGLKADDIIRELGYKYYRHAVGRENITLPRGAGGPVCLFIRPGG